MTADKKPSPTAPIAYPPYPYADDEIDLIELFLTLFRYKWLILILVFIGTFASYLYIQTITPLYKADIRFFVPKRSSAPSYSMALESLGFGGMLGGGEGSSDIILNLLNSRRLARDVIQEFNLETYYLDTHKKKKAAPILDSKMPSADIKQKRFETTLRTFQSSLTVVKDKSGLVTLSFSDTDPALAARITNYCVGDLDRINEELQITSEKPMVIVLDRAEKPMTKFKPKKKQMLIIGFTTSFMGSVFLVFLIEYIRKYQRRKK